MLDFGTGDSHSNRVAYDIAAVDGSSKYALAFFIYTHTSPGGDRFVFNKGGLNLTGINIGYLGADLVQMRHHDGVAQDIPQASDSALTLSQTDSYVLNYDGATDLVWGWKSGVAIAWSDDEQLRDVGSSANPLTLGGLGSPSSGNGLACALGHVMFWNGINLSAAQASQYHSGETIPMESSLSFWVKGTATPGKDEITQTSGTTTGTVTLRSDPADAYFGGENKIAAWREVFSRELRRRRFPEETYILRVPLEYLVLEVMDDLNISHDSLPRAASLLTDIDDNYLMERWRRMYALHTRQQIDLNSMSMEISLVNAEPYIAYAWATDMLPDAVSGEYDGLAQIDQGATHYNERTSAMWVEQADGRIATLPSGRIAINHTGFLPCAGATNPIQNSTFYYDSGGPPYFPGWTPSASGTFGGSFQIDLFVDDTFPNSVQIVKGAGDTYLEQGSIAITSSDGYRRFSFYYGTDLSLPGTFIWQIYRAAGEYWNDSTPGWQGGSVWNQESQADRWTRGVSEPITTPATENWTVRVGVTGTATYGIELAQVDLTEGAYVLAPIPTTVGNTFTTVDDERYFELDLGTNDNFRLCVPPQYGMFRCTFTAEQNGGDLVDDDELAIYYAQYDTSGDNYDVLLYQKLTGENVRFAFERYRKGTLEARALKDTTIVRGTAYELAARSTWDEFGTASTNGGRDFDATNDYYSLASDLAGNADSKSGIISVWVRLDGSDATGIYVLANGNARFYVARGSGNKLQVLGANSSGTTILDIRSTTSYTTSANWIHLLASWDLATTTTHLLINGVDDNNEVTATNDTIDYTQTSWAVGALAAGTGKFDGGIAELYFQPGEYLDFSDEDNVALFYRSNHSPEYLGGDGSVPTGDAPLIYLPSGNGEINCGKGGDFTENGSTDAIAGPGPHRTLSVFVAGTKGTDAQAESNQPNFDRPELCPDPTCATDFFDSKGTGWSHDSTNDEYDCSGAQSADSDLTEGSVCVSGRIYRVQFEVKNWSAGNVCPVCGTQEGTDRYSDGVYTEYITANGTDFIIRADSDFTGSVTNIYVCEDQYTCVYIGSAPAATGYLPAMNYISNWEIVPRAIPDEEIGARR